YPFEVIPTVPSDYVIALMRFCANGQLDTAWGGRAAEWWPGGGYDPAGGGSVNIPDGSGGRVGQGEGLSLADPPENKDVVGGGGFLPPGSATPTSYFVLARLNVHGTYDANFGVSPNPGRVSFAGGTNHVDDEVHSLQLVPNGANWDVLVAGPDRDPSR